MAFKYIALFALVSSAAAVAIQSYHSGNSHDIGNNYYQGGSLNHGGNYHQQEEHYAPAHYEFAYEVHDEHTGDIKSQKESRDGDKVQGYYTLVEPDGHRRIVHYTADKHSGFNAKVEREFLGHQYVQNQHQNQHHGAQIHKIIAQPVQKIAIAQPVQKIAVAQPVHYTSTNTHSLGGNSHSFGGNSHSFGGNSLSFASNSHNLNNHGQQYNSHYHH